jgi:hypothetical protein
MPDSLQTGIAKSLGHTALRLPLTSASTVRSSARTQSARLAHRRLDPPPTELLKMSVSRPRSSRALQIGMPARCLDYSEVGLFGESPGSRIESGKGLSDPVLVSVEISPCGLDPSLVDGRDPIPEKTVSPLKGVGVSSDNLKKVTRAIVVRSCKGP